MMAKQSTNVLESDNAAESQDMQRVLYLEDLLQRQVARLRKYDLDGAMAIAEETQPLAEGLAADKVLNRPEMSEARQRIHGLYHEVCMVIASERNEVADKLKQIREGLRALSAYGGK